MPVFPLSLLLDLLRLIDLLLLVEPFLLVDLLRLFDLLCDAFGLLERLFDFCNDLDFDLEEDLFFSIDANRPCLTESSVFSLETLLLLDGAILVTNYHR